jgi:hypothetical protein
MWKDVIDGGFADGANFGRCELRAKFQCAGEDGCGCLLAWVRVPVCVLK